MHGVSSWEYLLFPDEATVLEKPVGKMYKF